MSTRARAALMAAVCLAIAACTDPGGAGTPGTGGSAGAAAGAGGGAAGRGGGPAGTTGAAGAAGAPTGAAGAAGAGGDDAGGGAGSAGTGAAGSSPAGTGGGTTGTAGTTGSAGSAGSAGGAGGSAGSGAAGTGSAACAGALFCDDFESYTTGQAPGAPWSRQVSSGSTAAIDTAQARSGTKSVKFVAAAGSGSKTAFIRLMASSALPVTPNVFYGRMMFRLEAAPTGDVHWTFLQGSGLLAGQSYHALYRYGGQHPVMNGSTFVGSQLMANYETPDSYQGTGPKSDCWKHANKTVVPQGKWSCAEWQFEGTSNTMRFWLDGVAVDALTVMGTGEGCGNQPASYVWTAPTFDRMDFGWESYQQDSARTIWIDDVVLSRSKVGCP
jgi:hypothetical protein